MAKRLVLEVIRDPSIDVQINGALEMPELQANFAIEGTEVYGSVFMRFATWSSVTTPLELKAGDRVIFELAEKHLEELVTSSKEALAR